jgi:hypothetical protein
VTESGGGTETLTRWERHWERTLPGGARLCSLLTWAFEASRKLQELLQLWRLRAVAYSGPGYEERLAAARHGRAAGIAPAEQMIPGRPGRGPAR